MTLDDFIGLRTLDGRGEYIAKPDEPTYDEDSRVVLLRIDGKIWRFAEDGNDGYRSHCGEIAEAAEEDARQLVAFAPIVCEVRKLPSDEHTINDAIYFVNEATGLVVLTIGTVNVDDYYPGFISDWTPDGERPAWLESKKPA